MPKTNGRKELPSFRFGLGVEFAAHTWPSPLGRQPNKPPSSPTIDVPEPVELMKPSVAAKALRSMKTPGVVQPDALRRWHEQHSQTLGIRIPNDVQIMEPICLDWRLPDGLHANRLIVIAEQGSRATLIERVGGKGALTNSSSIVVLAEAGSSFTHIRVQNLPDDATDYVWRDAVAMAGASVTWLDCAFGASVIDRSRTVLAEPNASVAVRRLVFGDGERRIAVEDKVRHAANATASDIVFRGAAGDSSRVVNRAHADVPPCLKGCIVSEKSDTILWSPLAWAAALPEMSVASPESNCRHAAATGAIDPQRLFYLQTRGLDRSAALQLAVSGFFAPIIDDMRHRSPSEMIERLIAERFKHHEKSTNHDYDRS